MGIFKWFEKQPKKPVAPVLKDLYGTPIVAGDRVKCMRYELGESVVILEELHYYYQSTTTQEKVSYTRMVDAITGNQKVEKI